MGKYIINGGRRLDGRIELQTSKNAVLPILAASVLTSEQVVLEAFPKIDDVKNMVCILQSLGCRVTESGGSAVIDNSNTDKFYIPNSLAKELRSSIFLLGPVLGRFQYAKVSYPGGCDIGLRPIDLHLKGLKCLGVEINEHNGIMVEPDNVDDLAKAMQTMYYNISYYNRAEIARKIREDYSAQAVASRLMEQYERLARRAGSELVGSFSR